MQVFKRKGLGLGMSPLDFAKWTTSIISNQGMNDIMKIVKSLEEPALLMKGVNKTIKNKAKEQKVGFLDMLLYLLGVFLLRNLLEQASIFNTASFFK